MKKPKKITTKNFTGKIYWILPNFNSVKIETNCEGSIAEIPRAIKFENNFNMDWKSVEDEGGIKLKTKDNINFQGEFNYEDEGRSVTGKVQGRLYNNDGGCLFIGQWVENPYDFTWIAELKKISKVPLK